MSDLDLLRQYVQQGSEAAFSTLVERHLNLVYATALRHVRSQQLAEEVAQSVFIALARNARQLKPDTILTAWLYRVTRHAAIDLMRAESRRQLREQAAVEIANMKSDSADWKQIEPLLDEALESLDEKDRTAILLRFFENKSLREVGESIGATEEAARKRVGRAVEQLRTGFSRHGISIGAASLTVLLTAQGVSAVPTGLGASVTAAVALAGTTIQQATIIGTAQTITMTLFQKTAIAAALTIAVGAGIYEAHQTSDLREQMKTLQQSQESVLTENRQLKQERDEAVNKLAGTQKDGTQPREVSSELLKLRAEVARLRGESQELAQLRSSGKVANSETETDATETEMKSWLVRVKKLKERVDKAPNQKIPEFQFLTDQDWLDSVRQLKQLETDEDFGKAIGSLKGAAKNQFANTLQGAFSKFAKANDGALPTDFAQLKPYFPETMDDSVLQGYEFTQPGMVSNKNIFQVGDYGNFNSTQMKVSLGSTSISSMSEDSLKQAALAYAAANGQKVTDPNQLLPYVKTEDEKSALQKFIQGTTGK